MTHEPPPPPAASSSRGRGGARQARPPRDQIADAYERRAVSEINSLNREIAGCERCDPRDALPITGSGSVQPEIFLVKWSASPAERNEGVAFFGRAGSAILKSVERLGIEPERLYGTLCVKCTHQEPEDAARLCPPWLAEEIAILTPRLVVSMGPRVLEALNDLGQPLSEPLRPEPGVLQRWTPAIEAIYVPDIDESLDEQGAKRAFWDAFRTVGEWHRAQPPF